MKRTIRLLTCALAFPLVANAQVSSQRNWVRGSISDSAGHPLIAAEIEIPELGRTTKTDEDGQFSLEAVPAGILTLRIRAIGYRPQAQRILVQASTGWRGRITLSALPVQLPEVSTIGRFGKPPEYAYTTKYDDFFRRRRLGFGRFITKTDMEERAVTDFNQLLYWIPGVRVIHGKTMRGFAGTYSSIRMSRCPDLNVALYVDGIKVNWHSPDPPDQALADFLATILPHRLEFVEVYHGTSQVPSDLDRSACAAIVIWTR